MEIESFYFTAFLVVAVIVFLVIFFHYVPFFLWLSAKVSGVNISLLQLNELCMHWYLLTKQTLNCLSRWQRLLTSLAVMYSKLYRCQ